jgi:Cu/Ag efflux protein CusF
MKKLALLLSLAFVAPAFAAQAPHKAHHAKAVTAKTHPVAVEVVSVDPDGKTLTVKGEKEDMTMPVDPAGQAAVKDLKAGDKTTVICRDDAKGNHVAIAGVAPAKKK